MTSITNSLSNSSLISYPSLDDLLKIQQEQIKINDIQKVKGAVHGMQINAFLQEQKMDQEKTVKLKKNYEILKQNGSSALGKTIVKIGGKEVAFALGKVSSKEVAKKFSKVASSKLIPGVSVIVGICFGIQRCQKKEYGRALGEVCSGFTALIPVIGTSVSVGMDLTILGIDYKESLNVPQTNSTTDMSLEDAYKGMDIDTTDKNQLEKQSINKRYRELVKAVHSDQTFSTMGQHNARLGDNLTKYLNACRDVIFLKNGWKTDETKEKVLNE
jgi:hypothetical protein